MKKYDLESFCKVKVSGVDISLLDEKQMELLYTVARYFEAMCDADIDVMRQIVCEDMVFVHMSGRKQSREEFFSDIEKVRLKYYTIGIEDPMITVDKEKGTITYNSILNANAYGTRGTFRMKGTHHYELGESGWMQVNG